MGIMSCSGKVNSELRMLEGRLALSVGWLEGWSGQIEQALPNEIRSR